MFRFEDDFVATLRCIPMGVRMKLDQAGIKVSLKEWSKLVQEERRELAESPTATPADLDAFGRRVDALVTARMGLAPKRMPPPAPEWEADAAPADLADKARDEGFVLTVDTWRRLAPLQRFALCKLSRHGHENANFRPAAIEFGVPRA